MLLEQIGERWDHADIGWAVTGAMGASVLASYLTDDHRRCLCRRGQPPRAHNIARLVGIEPLDGGRLVLRPFPTATSKRLATKTDGIRVAPWPRVYADVRQVGVRGEEAAAAPEGGPA